MHKNNPHKLKTANSKRWIIPLYRETKPTVLRNKNKICSLSIKSRTKHYCASVCCVLYIQWRGHTNMEIMGTNWLPYRNCSLVAVCLIISVTVKSHLIQFCMSSIRKYFVLIKALSRSITC